MSAIRDRDEIVASLIKDLSAIAGRAPESLDQRVFLVRLRRHDVTSDGG